MVEAIDIIDYTDEHAPVFRKLNLDWLREYGLLESHDEEVVNDPRGTILNSGGAIYLAKAAGEIVGSAALMNMGQGEYELVKMAVTAPWQGRGISKLLMNKCLDAARAAGAKKIILFSNSRLQTALKLYEKYGFRHIEVAGSPFETADVKMELLMK